MSGPRDRSRSALASRFKMVRFILLGLAGAMIAAGVLQGEPAAIYRKAAQICLECIGLS
jgi:hypothetical protein